MPTPGAPKQGNPTRYGPRTMSAAEYAAQTEKKSRTTSGGVRLGRRIGGRVTGDKVPVRTDENTAPPADQGGVGSNDPPDTGRPGLPSLAELGRQLEAEPERLDEAMAAEFRQDRPRRGALELFATLERKRQDGPRAEVLAMIESYQS